MATNDITGDSLQSKPSSKEYEDGWERIFGKKEKKKDEIQDESTKKPSEENLWKNV